MRVVAVGVEDDGALAVHRFQAVGVELGLLFALVGVDAGAFGLDQGQGQAVVAPEDVVDVADAAAEGHAGDLVLGHVGAVGVPAGFAQQNVDEAAAGFGFGVVVGVGDGFVGRFLGGDLGLQSGELGLQRFVFALLLAQGFVAGLGVRCLLRFELGQGLADDLTSGGRQQLLVERSWGMASMSPLV